VIPGGYTAHAEPGSNRSTSPAGQRIVCERMSMWKSDLAKSLPLRAAASWGEAGTIRADLCDGLTLLNPIPTARDSVDLSGSTEDVRPIAVAAL
jgi:hypothetical protein